jgi:hypothetical protein
MATAATVSTSRGRQQCLGGSIPPPSARVGLGFHVLCFQMGQHFKCEGASMSNGPQIVIWCSALTFVTGYVASRYPNSRKLHLLLVATAAFLALALILIQRS